MADYTCPDGILNLITHYPEPLRSGATMPDVGMSERFLTLALLLMSPRTEIVFLNTRCCRRWIDEAAPRCHQCGQYTSAHLWRGGTGRFVAYLPGRGHGQTTRIPT